jgi:ribosomal peptide maturation radical SAM protein 1
MIMVKRPSQISAQSLNSKPGSKPGKVALVSAPWQTFCRPSIQLACLKAYAASHIPEVGVDTHHLYLAIAAAIGRQEYDTISFWDSLICESLYAHLLFPSDRAGAEKALMRKVGKAALAKVNYRRLISLLRSATNAYVDGVDWSGYALIGFSICLAQLTSSLYCIQRIKRRYPDVPIVVGGSAYGLEPMRRILNAFPEIDFAVIGEGEIPFVDLLALVAKGEGLSSMRTVPGVVTKGSVPKATPAYRQVPSLDQLPYPDFRDYFEQLQTLAHAKPSYTSLTIESSRGCSWGSGKHTGKGNRKGCAFCGLNQTWQGYRFKSAGRMAAEVDALTEQHRILSIAFTDNLLPVTASVSHFTRLSALNKDLSLFGELRATIGNSTTHALANAGFEWVQLGVEAFSTPLLRKMNKGTTVIQNLQAMKLCEEKGIVPIWNLLIEFPSSDMQDVEETLRVMQFAMPFRPGKLSIFELEPDSLVAADPQAYSVSEIIDNPVVYSLFPQKFSQSLQRIFLDYRGRREQRKLWQPVQRQVRLWQRTYKLIQANHPIEPILSYSDGGSFLVIRRIRLNAGAKVYRFGETSRALYLFCHEHQSFEAIARAFDSIREDHLRALLSSMVDQHLMFMENDRYLSLAVRNNWFRKSREEIQPGRLKDSKTR